MKKYTIDDIKPGFVFFLTEKTNSRYIALILSEIDQKHINIYFSDIKVSTVFSKTSILNVLDDPHIEGIKVD